MSAVATDELARAQDQQQPAHCRNVEMVSTSRSRGHECPAAFGALRQYRQVVHVAERGGAQGESPVSALRKSARSSGTRPGRDDDRRGPSSTDVRM
jgi:hypothetical protein